MPGFVLPKCTATITFEDTLYEGAEVTCRIDVNMGFFMDMSALMDSGGAINIMAPFAHRVLDSWNLEDEDGSPISCDLDGLRLVPQMFVNMLIMKWAETVANPPAPLAGPSPNGQRGPVQSGATEALSLNLGDYSAPNS